MDKINGKPRPPPPPPKSRMGKWHVFALRAPSSLIWGGGGWGFAVPFFLSKIVGNKLDDLENRSRRNNLCFEGIPESPNETWQESESKIKHLISSHMPEVGTDFVIERAHRVGRPRSDSGPSLAKLSPGFSITRIVR